MRNYITYLRTSTADQNLGIEAQREAAANYAKATGGKIIAEYSEHESGKNDNRPELEKAIAHCETSGATLLIAKLDRLSRHVPFLFSLKERLERAGLEAIAADMPGIMSSTLMLGVMASMAQYERELISTRTKAALAVKKAQGVKLGREKGSDMTAAYTKSIEVKKAAAIDFAKSVYPTINALREAGMPLLKIANVLNAQGTPTRKGGKWTATTVRRVLTTCSENLKEVTDVQ